MKAIKWIAVAALAVVFVACCPCRKSKSALVPFTGTEWKLIQLYGETVAAENNYRLTFAADGTLSGVGDCNRVAGKFTQNVGKLNIGENLATTRMFCPNQGREDKFFKMLTQIDSYSIDGTRMMLIRGGETLAIFEPVSLPEGAAAK